MDEFESGFAEEVALGPELYAVFAGGGEGEAVELEGEVGDGAGVFEIDGAPSFDDRRTGVVAVDDADGELGATVAVGHGDEDRQLRVGGGETDGVDLAEHPDEGLLSGQAVGDDLITDQ